MPPAAAGVARLEFALAVVVIGLIAAFALQRIAELQVSARDARLETGAAQTRAVAALNQARCADPSVAPASPPASISSIPASQAGAAPRVDSSVSACR